ncbi:MAG: NAD(P)/FAD-dependent oxidoreductase [Pseudomonadota bacterium]
MAEQAVQTDGTAASAEHFDVLIIGAGISGIGAAWHLQQHTPERSYAILEAEDTFGGTWETHKYPGIRSDSDLFTFGYKFKPWVGAPIATAEEINRYLREVLDENDIERHIRYNHWIDTAEYDRATQRWTLTATDRTSGTTRRVSCQFLWMCQGYYRHDTPYTPEWKGMADFRGDIIHPQQWPEDYDYSGKRVLVIGSGATAATVVPAMADKAGHVTMLQRSPTYFAAGLNRNEMADTLRELDVPDEWVHEITRRKINFDQKEINRRSHEEPEVVKAELLAMAQEILGEDFDYATHFTPNYRPWQQRLAFLPDGDLFQAIRDGKASVVTDHIDRFVENGVRLKSGEVLEADLILTATGFDLSVMGDIEFRVDDQPVDFSKTTTWRGMMFDGVPSMVWVFGYFRASWTLRADLIAEVVCRLLNQMAARGDGLVEPVVPAELEGMARKDWVEADNFNPGYLRRSMHKMPKQGDREPWIHKQDYWVEKDELPKISFDDRSLRFAPDASQAQSAG